MGHMVNPISYRLGYTHASSNVWHVRDSKTYSFMFYRASLLRDYLNKLFVARQFREFMLLSDIRVIIKQASTEAHVSFYSTLVYEFLHTIIRPRDKRSRLYRQLKLRVLKLLCRGLLQTYFMYNIFKVLTYVVCKDCQFMLRDKLRVFFVCVPQEVLSASGWTDFICHKLKKRNTFSHTMTQVLPILKDMLYQKVLVGFKLSCTGRLTRRGRSAAYIRSRNRTPFSTITALVSYSCRSVILKNSLCGIKVWSFFRRSPFTLKLIKLRSVDFSYPQHALL